MNERLELIRKYNLWDGKLFPSGLERPFYTNHIQSFIGSKLVKVITGQRRSGKSYLLRQIMNRLVRSGVKPQNILFISKEYIDFAFINDSLILEDFYQCYINYFKPEGKVYLFIDEIQNIEKWEEFVNSHSQDFTEDTELFISGSNSRLLSSELATLLSGRYIEFQVYPFRYNEYVEMTGQDISRKSYLEYLKEGGLPGMFELPTAESKSYYVASVKDTIMLRDIIQRNSTAVRDAKLLDDLFVYIISNASNPISIQSIVKYFKGKQRKVAYETIANYLSYICETFLIFPVMQYNIKGKATSESPYKYYANDLSFKNYLYPGIAYGIGYLLENAVFLELKKHDFNIYEGSIKDKEVDFVAIKGDRIIYIQCSYSIEDTETRNREYASLLNIQDNYEKWVVTLDELAYPIYEGIKHIQVWELEKHLSV